MIQPREAALSFGSLIVVEFLLYFTIMIPSVIVTHFNTGIQEGERW